MINNKKIRLNKYQSIKIITFLISFILVFVEPSHYMSAGVPQIFLQASDLFYGGVIHSKFFSVFEFLLIGLTVIIFHKSKMRFPSSDNRLNFLFIGAVLCYILNMANPNSTPANPVLGLPLFSNISEYTFLILLYMLCFTNKYDVLYLISLFIRYMFTLLIVRSFIIFPLWFLGIGALWYGQPVPLLEYSVLNFYSFFMALSITLYLINKKKKYIITAFLFFSIVFLSESRTVLLPGILTILGILFFYFTKIKNKLVLSYLTFILIIIAININPTILPEKAQKNIKRFMVVIPGFEGDKSGQYSDTGHYEQSKLTMIFAINKFRFWGEGYGSSGNEFLKGQSENIHNAYAGIWERFGIFQMFFYIFIIFIVIAEFISTMRNKDKQRFDYLLIKMSLIFFLLLYFLGAAFSPETSLTHIKRQIFWGLMLVYILRIDQNIYDYLFLKSIFNKRQIWSKKINRL